MSCRYSFRGRRRTGRRGSAAILPVSAFHPTALRETELVREPLGLPIPAAFGIELAEPAGEIRNAADRKNIDAVAQMTARRRSSPHPLHCLALVPVSGTDRALFRKQLAGWTDRCGGDA